jgi:hypothetical protein
MLYTYEVQFTFSPGCGWLRAPYVRPTYEKAKTEAVLFMDFAKRAGVMCAIRVRELNADEITEAERRIWKPEIRDILP